MNTSCHYPECLVFFLLLYLLLFVPPFFLLRLGFNSPAVQSTGCCSLLLELTESACKLIPWKRNYSPLPPARCHLWITGTIKSEPHKPRSSARRSLGYPPRKPLAFNLRVIPYLLNSFSPSVNLGSSLDLSTLSVCFSVSTSENLPASPCLPSHITVLSKALLKSSCR